MSSHSSAPASNDVVVSNPPPISSVTVPMMPSSGRNSPITLALSSAVIMPGRGSVLRICTYSASRPTMNMVVSIMRSQLGLSGAVYTCMWAGSQ